MVVVADFEVGVAGDWKGQERVKERNGTTGIYNFDYELNDKYS